MYQKFIIAPDGELRFGNVYMHRDLLNFGEDDAFGGGLWKCDEERRAILLYGRSFDFGTPQFNHLKRICWNGIGGSPLPLLYAPNWPDESVLQPIFVQTY